MSNDIRTLADVRPGGRVRLGDWLPPLPPMVYEERGTGMGPHDVYYTPVAYTAEQMRDYARAALSAQPSRPSSLDLEAMLAACVPGGDIADPQVIADNIRRWFAAQPSPGGQGDAPFTWSDRAKADALEAGQYAFTEADGKDLGYTACIEACVDAICLVLEMPEHRLALAARQPVGEPVIDYEDLLDQAKDLIHCGCSVNGAFEWLLEQLTDEETLAARQPSKQPDSVALGEATEFCSEKGDRQPVGEPVEMSPEFTDTARAAIAWVLWHHQGGSSPVGQPLRFALGMGQHDRMTDYQIAEAKRFAAWAGATIEGFHRRDPAQAVDLGAGVKAIAAERERQLQAEGFSRDCDQQYREGELARAATAYVQLAAMDLQVGTRSHIALQEPPFFWPWAPEWWKPVDARRDLVRAGALIAAQIDLIDSQAVGK
ncbi:MULTISPECIES: hypothetical protein [unclassified Stenotrophomonas]|uniref:hypothetical protein n=1 Tax=unclassified Stenotrophomonas TaxID=196198 RepID=UPI003BF7C001